MEGNVKAKPKIQQSLLNGFIREIPENQFLKSISKVINFEKFRTMLDNSYDSIGRCAYDPVILLKMLLLQRWYNLSDRAVVVEVADRLSFGQFLGLDITEQPPDDTTLVRFRNRLDENGLYDKLMDELEKQLNRSGLKIAEGRITIVDATFVEAYTRPRHGDPSHLEQNDPGAEITYREKKGPMCGYKAHIAMDAETRIIRQVEVTGAAEHEVQHLLIPPGTEELLADKGYHSAENRRRLEEHGVRDGIMYRGARAHPLSEQQKAHNRTISRARSQIESKFGEMKRWNGLDRAIYRGICRVRRQVILTVLAVNIKRLLAILDYTTG